MSSESEKHLMEEVCRLLNSGSHEITDEVWYNLLGRYKNYFNLVITWLFLHSIGFHINVPTNIIAKGTKLYRVRPFEEDIDFRQDKEWRANPKRTQNRANKQNQPALYLSSTPFLCELETFLKIGDKYVLGEYVVSEDIQTVSFCDVKHKHDAYHVLAIILNAFFIAPSRNEKNVDLFEFLDKLFSDINLDDMPPECYSDDELYKDMIKVDLPLRFGAMNRRNQLYEITNRMSDALIYSSDHKANAIRYSSCFVPIETACIISNAYNLALFEDGFNKVKCVNHEIKIYDGPSGNSILKGFIDNKIQDI